MSKKYVKISWTENTVPISDKFNDAYYSSENGLLETNYVFIDGNRLHERLNHGFQIAELGFGTGLNFLASCAAWNNTSRNGKFNFVSFEGYPMSPLDLQKAHLPFPELAEYSHILQNKWEEIMAGIPVDFGFANLKVFIGDISKTLRTFNSEVDCWYLDGFAPNKNPEMWTEHILEMVALRTKAGGSFSSYTAAGHVRRTLQHVGFNVTRKKGFFKKKHMIQGIRICND
jgi:tRNA U34 5-methylaminomethyl-2-thiouridine-forming methyltransferase MnmC